MSQKPILSGCDFLPLLSTEESEAPVMWQKFVRTRQWARTEISLTCCAIAAWKFMFQDPVSKEVINRTSWVTKVLARLLRQAPASKAPQDTAWSMGTKNSRLYVCENYYCEITRRCNLGSCSEA